MTLTDDLDAVWANFYHNLESHLGGALRGLGLAWGNCGGGGGDRGGWGIVREELEAALRGRGGGRAWCPDPDSRAAELWGFMVRPVVKRKAFLRMKIAGIYRGVSFIVLLCLLTCLLYLSFPSTCCGSDGIGRGKNANGWMSCLVFGSVRSGCTAIARILWPSKTMGTIERPRDSKPFKSRPVHYAMGTVVEDKAASKLHSPTLESEAVLTSKLQEL